jgi:hypothetical protein
MSSSIQQDIGLIYTDYLKELEIKQVEENDPLESIKSAQGKAIKDRVKKIASDIFCVDHAIQVDSSKAKKLAEKRIQNLYLEIKISFGFKLTTLLVISFIAFRLLGLVVGWYSPFALSFVFLSLAFNLYKEIARFSKVQNDFQNFTDRAHEKLCHTRSYLLSHDWSKLFLDDFDRYLHKNEISSMFKKEAMLWLKRFRTCYTSKEKARIAYEFILQSFIFPSKDRFDLFPQDPHFLAEIKQTQECYNELLQLYEADLNLVTCIIMNLVDKSGPKEKKRSELVMKSLTYAHGILLKLLERLEPFCVSDPKVLQILS